MTQQAEPVQDNNPPPPLLVAVRFGYLGWTGEFRHEPGLKLTWSDHVVVKTERGLEIGMPVAASCSKVCPKCVRPEQQQAYVRASGEDYMQRGAGEIVRVATAEDLAEQRRLDSYAREKMDFCQRASVQAGLDMRMIACEHLLGGERIVFYFTAEGRIDFRQLVRDLAREYHTRIEMRQIGARDEARIVADFEICGRECCCKNFLKVLRPVNMKMAKLQKATLDPTKVSGRCGRLRCCLRYEQETYEDLDGKLPEVGVRVRVENGVGIIRERQVITQLVVLDMGEGRRLAVPRDEILEILPPGEIGETTDRRPPLRRRSGPDARPERPVGPDAPEARGDAPQADKETPVTGEPGPAGEPSRAASPQRGRDGRDGGNGQPGGRRQGRGGSGRGEGRGPGGRSDGRPGRGADGRNSAGRGDGRADARPENREERPADPGRSSEGRLPAQDRPVPPPAQDSAMPPTEGPGNGQPTDSQGEAPDQARGRRRRRRGRRSRPDGQPPRADGNSSQPQ